MSGALDDWKQIYVYVEVWTQESLGFLIYLGSQKIGFGGGLKNWDQQWQEQHQEDQHQVIVEVPAEEAIEARVEEEIAKL